MRIITFGRIVSCVLLLWSAGTDIVSRRIPNYLIGAGLAVFLIMASLLWYLSETALLAGCFAAGVLAFILHLVPYLRRVMGAGDVKLALVVGLLTGWEDWLNYLAVFCVISLFVSGFLLLQRRGRVKTLPLAPVMASSYILYMAIAVFGIRF